MVKEGCFWLDRQQFHKGDLVTAWSYDGVRHVYHMGTITTINNSEVNLKLEDTGTKQRVQFAHVRQGNAMLVKD